MDARDVAAVAASALTEDGHACRPYTPTGPRAMTYDECATILSEVLGRTVRYTDPAPWTYWRRMSARGMPIGMRAVTLGIYTAARFGMAAALTSDVERLTGHPPIDFADFALAYREVWERPEGRSSGRLFFAERRRRPARRAIASPSARIGGSNGSEASIERTSSLASARRRRESAESAIVATPPGPTCVLSRAGEIPLE